MPASRVTTARVCLLLAIVSAVLWFPGVWAQPETGQTTRPVVEQSAIPLERLSPVSPDGHTGLAFLRKPNGAGPFPAVILVHGGAPSWDEATLHDFALHTHASRFLAAGYVVVAMTRRDLDLQIAFDAVQPAVLDAMAVYDLVAQQAYVDANSIVLRGTSVGGYIALELATQRPAAALIVEEPFAFPFVDQRAGTTASTPPEVAKILKLDLPLQIIEGDQTPNINDFNREVFIPALRSTQRDLEVQHFPGGLHSFAFYDSAERTPDPALSQRAFVLIKEFADRHVAVKPVALDAALLTMVVIPAQ
jgi:dienelactone hydrolase